MYCIKCGTRLPENANFCMNCGTRVEQRLQPNNMMEYYRSVIGFSYTKVEMTGGYWYHCNSQGKVAYLKAFNERGCRLLDFDGKTVFCDYDDYDFYISKEGIEYYSVKKDEKWALRTKDRLLTQFLYDKIHFIWNGDSPGIVQVSNAKQYGFIELETGKTIFDCIFKEISSCCAQWPNDWHPALKGDRWGIINVRSGAVVHPFVFFHDYEAFRVGCNNEWF